MAWVRFDPGFSRHKKRLRSTIAMNWLWVCGMDYAVEHMTDGFLPKEVIGTLSPLIQGRLLKDTVAGLVRLNAWKEHEDGYLIHDFLEYQEAAAEVRRQREAGKQRARDWRRGRNGERTPHVQANEQRTFGVRAGERTAHCGQVVDKSSDVSARALLSDASAATKPAKSFGFLPATPPREFAKPSDTSESIQADSSSRNGVRTPNVRDSAVQCSPEELQNPPGSDVDVASRARAADSPRSERIAHAMGSETAGTAPRTRSSPTRLGDVLNGAHSSGEEHHHGALARPPVGRYGEILARVRAARTDLTSEEQEATALAEFDRELKGTPR